MRKLNANDYATTLAKPEQVIGAARKPRTGYEDAKEEKR